MTISDLANHLKMSWNTVKDIVKGWMKKVYGHPSLTGVKRIAIDEISIGKNHRYLTIVLDLDRGRVLHVGNGKGASALDAFFERIKQENIIIEAVAIDMSKAYISAVSKHLPDALVVFDHFHVIKEMNEQLTNIRRRLASKDKNLKGCRWLLLKNPSNLDDSKGEVSRLEHVLELNKPLAKAYILKEQLRQFYQEVNYECAEKRLRMFIFDSLRSGVKELSRFARTLYSHFKGILAFHKIKISTGPLEGVNNKIKTLQKRSYGFRDLDFFKTRIYGLHDAKYELIG
jgi:transposase